jgi:hypothetical protein
MSQPKTKTPLQPQWGIDVADFLSWSYLPYGSEIACQLIPPSLVCQRLVSWVQTSGLAAREPKLSF